MLRPRFLLGYVALGSLASLALAASALVGGCGSSSAPTLSNGSSADGGATGPDAGGDASGSRDGGTGGSDGGDAGRGGAPSADSGAPANDAGGDAEGTSPEGGTLSTCSGTASTVVGSYVVEANFWNQRTCPGTQCMSINTTTGAYTVTQSGTCTNLTNVASYPNHLYGTSFGNTSPSSVLPMQLGAVTSVTSSWDFSVGGASTDAYDVAYDIWFCPNNSCGAGGFGGGTELMIWLDYQGCVPVQGGTSINGISLSGYTWSLWTKPATGNGSTYLAYAIQGSMVTSVADLDLNAFFQDALSRGYVKNNWYLYAVQAGDEIRSGGMPYSTNSFSVTVN